MVPTYKAIAILFFKKIVLECPNKKITKNTLSCSKSYFFKKNPDVSALLPDGRLYVGGVDDRMRPEGFGRRFYPRHIHREEDESAMGFDQLSGANGTEEEQQARHLKILYGLIAKDAFSGLIY